MFSSIKLKRPLKSLNFRLEETLFQQKVKICHDTKAKFEMINSVIRQQG